MSSIHDPAAEAAAWLAEAWTTGNPLATLPPGLAPLDVAAGEDIAAALLEALGQPPVGLRLGPSGLVGPLLAGRLVANRTPIALAGLRHARVSAAVVGVLAAALAPDDTTAPVFARLHPALDVAASRFAAPPADAAQATADLAGLGMLVLGPGQAVAPGVERVALAEGRRRPAGAPSDLAARLGTAAAEARARGGLPAGALLCVAGLTVPVAPGPGQSLCAILSALGRARADFV